MVTKWLATGMFYGSESAEAKTLALSKANVVVPRIGHPDPANFPDDLASAKPHMYHIPLKEAQEIFGDKVLPFDGEGNDALQDAILSVHHACILTLIQTPAYKIIENHDGVAFIENVGRE